MFTEEITFTQLGVPEEICKALEKRNILNPTPIQVKVLPKSIRDRFDILGAAPTGSGKTLAFGVPLLVRVAEIKAKQQQESDSAADEANKPQEEASAPPKKKKRKRMIENFDMIEELDPLTGEVKSTQALFADEELPRKKAKNAKPVADNKVTGLVILPTRELALQVRDHLSMYAELIQPEISIQALVGGISIEKQQRLLLQKPDVIVATPGRLWELLRQGQEHLSTMQHHLKCLVVDEADRLLETQHFEEVRKILRFIYSDKTSTEIEDLHKSAFDARNNPSVDVRFGQLSRMQKRRVDQFRKRKQQSSEEDKSAGPSRRKIQILVFSATLTFVHKDALTLGGKKRLIKGKTTRSLTKDMKLNLLRNQLGMSDRCLVVDLSNQFDGLVDACQTIKTKPGMAKLQKDDDQAAKPSGISGPATLQEFRLLCSKKAEKDSRLLWLLLSYRMRAKSLGLPNDRCIVFVNSKANLRRIVGLCRLLHDCDAFNASVVNVLHADMTQKQRLKAVERFQADLHGLLLASDVASRGLDLAGEGEKAGVGFVVHFEVPHTAELYIHRRGRVARAGRKGVSVLLQEPTEGPKWRKLCLSIKRHETELRDLNRLMDPDHIAECDLIAQKASGMDVVRNRANKKASQTDWFLKAAREADIELEQRDLEQALTHGIFDEATEGWQRTRGKKQKRKNQMDFAKSDLKGMIEAFKSGARKRMHAFNAELDRHQLV